MENAVFGFFGALIGSVLGFIGSLLSTFGKSKDSSKDVLTRTVTNERAQWRNDLRLLAGEFIENALRISSGDQVGSIYTIEKQRALIRFRLNPDPEHKLDASIMECMRQIVKVVRTEKSSDLMSSLEQFEQQVQLLLKQEWDKSKKEAETGNLDVKK